MALGIYASGRDKEEEMIREGVRQGLRKNLSQEGRLLVSNPGLPACEANALQIEICSLDTVVYKI